MAQPKTDLYREAVVEHIARESECVASFRLRLVSGEPFPAWEPGAHIAVNLPNGLMRQYSLCGSVADRSSVTIAVLREPNSRGGSEYLHGQISVGDSIRIGDIRNNFPLIDAKEFVFVAGGIGVTPLIPMIENVAKSDTPWRLVYGGKSRSSMAYIERLTKYGPNVQICPQDECGLLNFEADVTEGLAAGAVVYACGPEVMLTALETHCSSRGINLYLEHFRASDETLQGSGANKPFICELRRTGRKIDVGADQSIIEALEGAGIFTKSDCREGTCGSCETAVLAGEIEHRDALLSDEERLESKTMMICVSRATSEDLVLDL